MRQRSAFWIVLAFLAIAADGYPTGIPHVRAGEPGFAGALYGVRHAAYSLEGSLPVDLAVKVAEGYLISSIEGMGRIGEDMMADPRVVLLQDGKRYQGSYVDFDPPTGLALIRAAVPGTPLRFAANHAHIETSWIVGARADDLLGVDMPILVKDAASARCSTVEDLDMRQCDVWRDSLPLTVELVVEGTLVAAFSYGRSELIGDEAPAAGPSAASIRRFLDRYFKSMGASIRPKPSY